MVVMRVERDAMTSFFADGILRWLDRQASGNSPTAPDVQSALDRHCPDVLENVETQRNPSF